MFDEKKYLKFDKGILKKRGHRKIKHSDGYALDVPTSWGDEFQNKKTVSYKGWNFEILEEYKFFYDHWEQRYGFVGLDIKNAPGETIAQRLYNDDPKTMRHEWDIEGCLLSMPEEVHLRFSQLEGLCQTDDFLEICEANLEEHYRKRIRDIKKYGDKDGNV